MVRLYLVIVIMFSFVMLHAQINSECIKKTYVVSVDKLNMRKSPSVDSDVINQLSKGEQVLHLESVLIGDKKICSYQWLKIKRIATGEIGFICGQYVHSLNRAFLNYGDLDRLGSGFWYGISKSKGKILFKPIKPTIKEFDGFRTLYLGKEYDLAFCLESEIIQNEIFAFPAEEDEVKFGVGDRFRLPSSSNGNSHWIAMPGEAVLKNGVMYAENERVIFVKGERDNGLTNYKHQDLTDCLYRNGEGGYVLHFAGDINGDGVPELVLSEGNTKVGHVYFFMSNEDGDLELVAINSSYSKC